MFARRSAPRNHPRSLEFYMDISALKAEIETAWDARDGLSTATTGPVRAAVDTALDLLDGGAVRVAEKTGAGWVVNDWLKKAVLLSFRLNDNALIPGASGGGASWVIIEDNCFIGARSEVVEGVLVEEGAVLSMGVFIGASTKIIDRVTGEVFMGRVPAYSVVVPGSVAGKPLADGSPGPSLYCAVIIKRVDAQTRSKVGINELLRT
jgi:tetrahydrodipicolinate N-succinyltransferase